ncbi:hypothetical protein PUN28_011743 [Cardiocondyla obscurior]|uniref:Odorant receptor n=1 Tax=Cardiocondyla obscurior TaxID=286306 RepID=A0AAW2FFC5_9HYME
MDFNNVNLLNSRINVLSGNLLPIKADNSQFSVFARVHSAAVWLSQVVYIVALYAGMVVTPKEKSIKDGTVAVVISVEAAFMLTNLYSRKKLMREIIQIMNEILQSADDVMKDITKTALHPIITPFVIYGATSVLSITVWTGQPVMLALNQSDFYYTDYNLPAAFSAEPFSSRVFVSSTIIMTVGSVYLFLKKFGVDVYMMHLVLMLTAQYRYAAVKLTMLCNSLQNYDEESQKEHFRKENLRVKKELRKICHHLRTLLNMSFILKKLLSVNFSLLYVNNVFRFCFVGMLLSTVPSLSFSEAISIISYAMGSVMQFFVLCSSVQTLSDASTKITDQAFDEDWYHLEPSMKRTFMLLIMSNNLECKIAAIGKFNLSLPSFMTVRFIMPVYFLFLS